jgi:DNA-binding transcriptional LysR family regulator
VFGAIVIDTARKMLDSQEAITRAIGQTASLEGGELSNDVGPCPADTWMGQVSGRLLQRYPQLRISIRVEPWASLPEFLS